jgi:hypothetical protein
MTTGILELVIGSRKNLRNQPGRFDELGDPGLH